MRVDIVRTRHFREAAPFLADRTPADGQSQMNDLAGEQSVLRRRVGCGFHGCFFSFSQLRRSYQYMY
jgi:hypothetical protein